MVRTCGEMSSRSLDDAAHFPSHCGDRWAPVLSGPASRGGASLSVVMQTQSNRPPTQLRNSLVHQIRVLSYI